jgi:predicted O-linked N-acetylglucosamine transferase (SPINDLY family)
MATVADMFALALHYHQLGDVQQAEPLYRQIIEFDPNHADAWQLLGEIAIRGGRHDLAIEYIGRAISLNPGFAAYYSNLGVAYDAIGRVAEAAMSYQRALELQPAYPEARNNLGVLLRRQGRLDEAAANLREAVRLRPDYAEAHNNLGIVLLELGKLDEALASCRDALYLSPSYAAAHCTLGNVLRGYGNIPDALASYHQALYLQPEYADGYYNLGTALKEHGSLDEAEANFRQVVRLQPNFATAYNSLAVVLQDQGKLDEAVACYQEALRLCPGDVPTQSNYLLCLNYLPKADPAFVFSEHRKWGDLHSHAQVAGPSSRRARDPERSLRVGYVSPDLRFHVLVGFLEPILAHHDPDQVEAICYAQSPQADEVTARLQSLSRGWRRTWGLSDAQVEELVREDGIDILVDLAGHTAGNRLGVFARKPAPVQVSYLGYCNTTGLAAIDFRLTDDVADPLGEPSRHTEVLLRLPAGFCCYKLPAEVPDVNSLPALRDGHLTFGSLHSLAKLNKAVLDLWCEILRAVPSARLLVFRHTLRGETKDYFAAEFAARGIQAERVELRHVADPGRNKHFRVYNEIDMSLDAFPWGGHATACESLWMGVPVITLYGPVHAGRMVASVLTRAGLSELIAETPAKYLELAVNWAGNLERLAGLRSRLRTTMEASPLCDGKRFTRGLEEAYRSMWQRWCVEGSD